MYFNKISMAVIGLSSMGYAEASAATSVETFWILVALFALNTEDATVTPVHV